MTTNKVAKYRTLSSHQDSKANAVQRVDADKREASQKVIVRDTTPKTCGSAQHTGSMQQTLKGTECLTRIQRSLRKCHQARKKNTSLPGKKT
jgi:hypothetical protein